MCFGALLANQDFLIFSLGFLNIILIGLLFSLLALMAHNKFTVLEPSVTHCSPLVLILYFAQQL